MDLSIRRISSTVRAGVPAPAADPADERDLDRLAAVLLERQQQLLAAADARSLAPDDPAGDLGGWS